jgi:hypothetical protein
MSAGLATSTASSRDEDELTPSLGIALVMDTHARPTIRAYMQLYHTSCTVDSGHRRLGGVMCDGIPHDYLALQAGVCDMDDITAHPRRCRTQLHDDNSVEDGSW